MYGGESWTIKKAESQSFGAFKLCCWRRPLRVPGTARKSNFSIQKEISPEYSLEGLMLKPKLQTLATWWEELTHWKWPWCWERLKAGGEGGIRGWDGWMTSLTWWNWVCVSSGSLWWTGKQWKQWHFIFLDSKITADDDCCHEIKRCLLLGRKAVRNQTVY